MFEKDDNLVVILFLIIIINVLAGFFALQNNNLNVDVQKGVKAEEQVEVKDCDCGEKKEYIGKNINDGVIYKNEEYGFEFSFEGGYKNIWYASEKVINEEINIASITFYIKNEDVNFLQFTIDVRDKGWWENNAEVDSNGSGWIKGKRGIPNALHIYLGENDNFVFTLWPNNQSCPDLGEDGPGPLCKLVKNDEEMILNSFKIYENNNEL
jgi:hypothetical protein